MVKTKAARRRHLVEALRSGEFKQGKAALEWAPGCSSYREPGSNCCLGVACRVAIADGLDVSVENDGSVVAFDGATGMLPASVADWYGFTASNGAHVGSDDRSLVGLNDSCSYTFEQIADIIEAEPEGLFTS